MKSLTGATGKNVNHYLSREILLSARRRPNTIRFSRGPECLLVASSHDRQCRRVYTLVADSRHLLSELVREPELEKVLHHRQLIGDGQRATRARRTPITNSRVRKAEGTETAA